MARANIKKNNNVEFKQETIKEIKIKEEKKQTKWGKITLIGLWTGMGIAAVAAVTVLVILIVSFFKKDVEVENQFKDYYKINSTQLSYLIGQQEGVDQYGTFEGFLNSDSEQNKEIYNILTASDSLDLIYIYFYKSSLIEDDPYINGFVKEERYKKISFFFFDIDSDDSFATTFSYIDFPERDYFLLIFNVDNPVFTTVPIMEFKVFSQKNQINTLINRYFDLLNNKGE